MSKLCVWLIAVETGPLLLVLTYLWTRWMQGMLGLSLSPQGKHSSRSRPFWSETLTLPKLLSARAEQTVDEEYSDLLDQMREQAAWLIDTTHLLARQASKLQAQLETCRVELDALERLAASLKTAAG